MSRQHSGAPDVYLFRKTADVLYHADRVTEEMEQHKLLEAVWRRWTQTDEGYNIAGYQRFNDLDEFERRFEVACASGWRGAAWSRRTGLGARAAGLAILRAGGIRRLSRAGLLRPRGGHREGDRQAAAAPFLLLIGASGSGKSSLLRAGLVPRITRPGTIPDVELWRAAIVLPAPIRS